MPARRRAMRKILEVLRLRFESKLSHERIAAATRMSKGAVTSYLQRAKTAGLVWPLPTSADDTQLEALLFPRAAPLVDRRAAPDLAHLHQELKRKGVTLMLLWEEYAAAHAGQAYGYSQFCLLYHRFAASLKRSMRQIHRAGDKLFIDYAGQSVPIIDAATGEILRAQIFVAVLGASSYTYAEASLTQQLPDWIASHVRCFEYMGCVAALLVPDNLKSAIKRACRYEPECTSTYEDLARHYGTAILPARPYRPRDKAAAEMSVLLVERWILARVRNRQFFSLEELNAAIRALLIDLNNRPFKKLDGCRRSAFETIDRPAMKPLAQTRYEFAEWKKAIVNIDYHVECDERYYSVPHSLVKRTLELRVTVNSVECFFKGKQVAAHRRAAKRGDFITLPEHMPDSHRKHLQWTPGRFLNWAISIGPATRDVVKWQLENRPHPEQGYRACLGLLNLVKHYGAPRLEAACARALAIGSPKRKSIKSILEAKLDQHPDLFPASQNTPSTTAAPHRNVRGADYFRCTTTSTTSQGDIESCSCNPSSIH
jgi:transposase